jgi:hypothetical protein
MLHAPLVNPERVLLWHKEPFDEILLCGKGAVGITINMGSEDNDGHLAFFRESRHLLSRQSKI